MVILIIQVKDFSSDLVNSERDPPVAGDDEAPCSLAVSRELMYFPTRDIPDFLDVFHLLQEGQNVAEPLHESRSQAGSIVMLNEAPQSPMDQLPNLGR